MSEIRIPLRFRDLDELGHLTHSVYHDFLAEGRVHVLGPALAAGEFPWVIVNITLDYLHEVRRDDEAVMVRTAISRLGSKSVTCAQSIELTDGTRCAEGQATLVAWDARARTSRAITDAERAALEPLVR